MRLLVLTHRRSDPSFRLRWERFLPLLRAEGVDAHALEIVRRRAAAFRAARDADLVVLHRKLLTRVDLARLRRSARRLSYDFDDALPFRPEPPHRSRTRAKRFFRTVAAADAVIAGNRYLASLAGLRARRVVVVPTTADPSRFDPDAERAQGFVAVWTGQRATLPHLRSALDAVLAAGATIPGFRMRVVADAAPPGTEHVPWSEEAEARSLSEAHVGLMPLPASPYTRGKCGYKLLLYHAAGLPAVASPVGTNRALAEGGAILAREPADWAAALRRLHRDPDLRARLGARGRAFVESRYAPAVVAPRLVRILRAAGS